MDWKLELVVVPVTDVDRAKRFYSEQVGFAVDHDTRVSDDVHIVQLTPPGSACSIAITTGMVKTPPGSVEGLQLVPDIEAARTQRPSRASPSAGSSTAGNATASTVPAAAGTPSSSSATPTATPGPSRNAPPPPERNGAQNPLL